jgi:NAD(P)H-nitrite reductase large subunit
MDAKQTIICRCEEVTLGHLIETLQEHKCTSRELKLRTRAGMGYCGGRTCRCMIDQLVMSYTQKKTPHPIPLGYQPPVRPINFFNGG